MIREYIIKISDEIMEEEIADRPQELIRCKHCKHHGKGACSAAAGLAYPPPDEWYCADGERE